MRNIFDRLTTIKDLEKNLSECLQELEIKKEESKFYKQIQSDNKKLILNFYKIKKIKKNLNEIKMNLKKIKIIQENYNSLLENYENIKILSNSFLNMKRCLKYSEKLKLENIKKINLENIKKIDKLKNKLIFYSKDLNKKDFLIIKPIIDEIEKEFLNFECIILRFALENFFLESEDQIFKNYNLNVENVLQILNICQEIDDETFLAKKGKDGFFKEKKEYFHFEFENGELKYLINKNLISVFHHDSIENIQNIENRENANKDTVNYDTDTVDIENKDNIDTLNYNIDNINNIFFKENKWLAYRKILNLKIRFIKNLFSFLVKREIQELIKDIQFLLENPYFDKKIENSIFSFLNEMLILKLNISYDSASEILILINFFNSYNELLKKYKINFKKSIIDINFLKNKYSEIMKLKLKIWIENISNLEIKSIKERNFNFDENNNYISLNFINLLKIIKEVLEPVYFDKILFDSIILSIKENIKIFKENILEILKNEYQKNKKTFSSGFEEYCICISNSGLKMTKFITLNNENKELIEMGEIFLKITKYSNSLLIQFVIQTLKPAFKKLFLPNFYENENEILKLFKATLIDFLDDYKKVMDVYVFLTFISDLVLEIQKNYFNQLIKKKKFNSRINKYFYRKKSKIF